MPTTFRLSCNPTNLRTYAPHATVEASAAAAYEAFHERQEERRGR